MSNFEIRAPVGWDVYSKTLTTWGRLTQQRHREFVKDMAGEVLVEARTYEAPPLPTYTRTFETQKSWSLKSSGSQGWAITSSAPGARWTRVPPQAEVHVGRWNTLPSIIERRAGRAGKPKPGVLRRVIRFVAAMGRKAGAIK